MPHPFCDGNGIEARINQQADVAMMDVVDAYALYSCLLYTSLDPEAEGRGIAAVQDRAFHRMLRVAG